MDRGRGWIERRSRRGRAGAEPPSGAGGAGGTAAALRRVRTAPGRGMVLGLVALGVVACSDADSPTGPSADAAPPPPGAVFARAFGIWEPSGPDTCSEEIHDGYHVVGPDGLVYPTWHPPVDPITGCTFGHEHGRNPAGSDLYAEVGPIPFGYANEHLLESGFGAERHEDHVGHKIEWENDMEMRIGDGGSALFSVTCDVLTKMHQGTHSPDAYTNNLHEVAYHVRCSDGTGFSATLLTPIGRPGELVAACDRGRRVAAGPASPLLSPEGGGRRAIPTRECVRGRLLAGDRPRFDAALRESWEINARLRADGGRTLVAFNPYFQVLDPSRFYDPAAERALGRSVALCGLPELAGTDRCEGVAADLAWDHPRSPFRGTRRFVDVNANRVRNERGPTVWYTDPLGRNAQPTPFPGSIRQWIAAHDNSGLDLHGRVMGRNRDYAAEGVHAPN